MLRPIKYSSQIRRLFYDEAFTNYLAECGYPARRFIRNKENGLTYTVDDKTYCMTEHFEGVVAADTQTNLSDVQLIEAASQLAKLHQFSRKYQGPKYQRLPFQSKKSYNTLNSVLRHINSKPEKDDFDKLVVSVIRKKIECIAKKPFEKQNFLLGPRMMNHGDYHAGNIVFDSSDHIIAVLDFEFCVDMPRVWDIALAITWLCQKDHTEAFCGPNDLRKIAVFLSAYNDVYPLSCDEQTYLNTLYISASYHSTYFLEHYYLRQRTTQGLEKCNNISDWFWWVEHQGDLRELVCESC